MPTPDPLSQAHRTVLEVGSAISPAVIAARGYRTVTVRAELHRLGFSEAQLRVPSLLIPVWSPAGDIGLYQARPDAPRILRGKAVKYETPSGSRMALDVPPTVRHLIGDPAKPLFVTEGIKKGDALASQGCCAVALLGVWNWRGTNEHGGKTALPEWEMIALNGRTVYILFDSDVMLNPQVYGALLRLKAFLENRGARVLVIYLLPGDGGTKVGVDDFFASGHTLQDLLVLATAEVRLPPVPDGLRESEHPYRSTETGLVWLKPTGGGTDEVRLTNFGAAIVADVAEDDGAEVRRSFEIEARLRGRVRKFTVPAPTFAAMNWPAEHLGAGAVVYPGFGTKDHARVALQLTSGDIPERPIYTHTGWRKTPDGWVYLHAEGAIGANGLQPEFAASLPTQLAGFALPDPVTGEGLKAAIRASVRIVDLATERVTVPLFAAIWRAVLGGADHSQHISGETGAGKTELAALAQQHFGPLMDARHLPGGWSSTGNALEAMAFSAKDALLAVDDFVPTGSASDIQRQHRDADRLLRGQGNLSGRARMRADTTLRPPKPPRGLIVSTGEDVPKGQSLQARVLASELPKQGPGSLDWQLLGLCQRDAAAGLYAQALSGFVRWLAPRYERISADLRAEVAALRGASYLEGQHRRTSAITASLCVAVRHFCMYAEESGAFTTVEAEAFRERCWAAITSIAASQAAGQTASEPTRHYLDLLGAALSSGRAHVAGPDGSKPKGAEAWGWRQVTVGGGEYEHQDWRPSGERIGWVAAENLYLQPDSSYAAAQRLARDSNDALGVTLPVLKRRLKDRGLLASTEPKRETTTVRKMLEGAQRNVLHLRAGALVVPPSAQPDKPDIAGPTPVAGVPAHSQGAARMPAAANVGNVGSGNRRDADPDAGRWGSV